MLGSQSNFTDLQTPGETGIVQAVVKPFLLRRNKSEVLTELPEKSIIVQWCDMTSEQQQFYRDIPATVTAINSSKAKTKR